MIREGMRVKHKAFGKGRVSMVSNPAEMDNNILVFHDNGTAFYCKEEDLTILTPKTVCPDCGLDYPEDVIEHHRQTAHKQLEQIMMSEDERIKHRAEQYEKVVNMVFMSCGIVMDGFSTQYIIDPSTVCDELLKIIVTDLSINRDQIVEKKQEIINKEVKGW